MVDGVQLPTFHVAIDTAPSGCIFRYESSPGWLQRVNGRTYCVPVNVIRGDGTELPFVLPVLGGWRAVAVVFDLEGDEVDQRETVDARHPELRPAGDDARGPWGFPADASLGIHLDIPCFPFVEDAEGVVVGVAFHTSPGDLKLWHRVDGVFDEGDNVPLAVFQLGRPGIAEGSL